jgi:hypothetical protein
VGRDRRAPAAPPAGDDRPRSARGRIDGQTGSLTRHSRPAADLYDQPVAYVETQPPGAGVLSRAPSGALVVTAMTSV